MENKLSALEAKVKQLEQQLEQANAERLKYKKLFEVSGDALSIVDLSTGKFVECNQAAIDMHGVQSKSHFLNLTPADISPELQPCGRTSKQMAQEYIANTFSQGPQLFQWMHSKLDGSAFPCLISLTALPLEDSNLVLAIGRDISELVETQVQLAAAVSDKKRFQSAYLEEKEKFEQFVNLAPIGIAINKIEDGSFEYVNDEFSRFTGYDVDELNQMDYWHLTPKKYERQEQVQLKSLSEIGRYGPYQKEYIHKRGHLYPVLLSGIKIAKLNGKEYIWSVVQDITEQKRIEQEIQDAKEQTESTVLTMKLANDSAGIGIWQWDALTDTLIWDEWMYTLYGIKEEDFSGVYQAWESRVHPDDAESAKEQFFKALETGSPYEPEFRVVHPDGKVRTIKASSEIIRDEEGKALRIIGVNYDITDKIKAIAELKLAKQEADRANKAKSEFLANMSHEIRTPLNAILGSLQLLNRAELGREYGTLIENAVISSQSLLTIINDILDYSKIEDKKLDLESKPFSVLEVIEAVKFDVALLVSNKGLELSTLVEDCFVDSWLGDIVRVKQVLLNLVSNAVKFTEKGSVSIKLKCTKHQGKDALCINVVDTGIGMSQEAQSRIFERFTQADSSTTRKFGGTGLGMSITLNLIKIMAGTIELTSELGQGTNITVILPLAKADNKAKAEKDKAVLAPELADKNILIAEDNKINQVLIESMLAKTNANLTIVENGKLAVEQAATTDFDLILMDIHMPELDGIKAQQQIKQLNSDIPVVALTANVMVEDINLYLAQGFAEHVGKPIDINKLYGVLCRYLVE